MSQTEHPLGIRELQEQIERLYYERDSARGTMGTFAWFVEEVGELSRALRRGEPGNLEEELGDCLAWLVSLASLTGVDMDRAARKYAGGCPRCGHTPCACPHPAGAAPASPPPDRGGPGDPGR